MVFLKKFYDSFLCDTNELVIYRRYFPAQMGHLLDPCDNSFHASVHKRYWGMLARYKKVDLLTQIKIIHKSYFLESESSVKSYFEKCGITGTTPPEKVLSKLFFDGVYPTSKFRALHEEQLNSYLKWKFHGRKSIVDIFGDHFQNLFSQKQ